MSDRPQLMRLDRDGEIATIVLTNPDKLNAWSWESARQISAIADEVRFDDSVRCVILRAEGRAFCAGVDLGMPEDRITGRSPAEKVRNYYEKFRWVHERFKVFAEWDLSRLVFDQDEYNAAKELSKIVTRREDLLTTINKLYFARRQLQAMAFLSPAKSTQKALKHELQLAGLTADLDALTGGWFSRQVQAKNATAKRLP